MALTAHLCKSILIILIILQIESSNSDDVDAPKYPISQQYIDRLNPIPILKIVLIEGQVVTVPKQNTNK